MHDSATHIRSWGRLPLALVALVAVLLLAGGCAAAASSDAGDEASAPEYEQAAVEAESATDEAEAVTDEGAVSSPERLVPLGEVGSLHWKAPVGPGVNWDVTVSGVDFDAGPQGQEEAVAGRQNVLIELTLTNRSSAAARTMGQVNGGAVGGAKTYLQNIDNCGYSAVEKTLGNPERVEPGETVKRTICWQVEPADVDSLRVWFDPASYQERDFRVWFALR